MKGKAGKKLKVCTGLSSVSRVGKETKTAEDEEDTEACPFLSVPCVLGGFQLNPASPTWAVVGNVLLHRVQLLAELLQAPLQQVTD